MSFLGRSTRKAPYLLVASALLFGAACGETPADEVVGECWPIDSSVAGQGSIQIGSGFGDFSSFQTGQDVNVEAGGQGGYHIRVAVHIQDLAPGQADNILSEDNPRTLLNLVDKNGDSITNATCPSRIPYGDKGDGLELLRSVSLVFPLEPDVRMRYNKEPVTIRAEIIDADGNFAVTEHQIIARFPKEPPTIASPTDPGEVMAPSP